MPVEKTTSAGLGKPPEGVVAGENVPPGSEPDAFDEQAITEAVGVLNGRGEPYSSMSESETREKAIELLREHGGDI